MINYVILAGGQSRRMQLNKTKFKSKVLIPINGIPIIARIVATLQKTDHAQIYIIVNSLSQTDIQNTLAFWFPNVEIRYIVQVNQTGTADCIKCLKLEYPNLKGKIITICGDNPGIKLDSLNLISKLNNGFISTKILNPKGYGRVVYNNNIPSIVEEINCTDKQKLINEVNTGIYCLDTELTFMYIDKIQIDIVKQEYFLTDIFTVLSNNNIKIDALYIEDSDQFLGINQRQDLDLIVESLEKPLLLMDLDGTLCQNSAVIVDSMAELLEDLSKTFNIGIVGEATKQLKQKLTYGTTIYPKECDKSQIMKFVSEKDVIYIGDKIFQYGNDCTIAMHPKINMFISVKNSDDTYQKLMALNQNLLNW